MALAPGTPSVLVEVPDHGRPESGAPAVPPVADEQLERQAGRYALGGHIAGQGGGFRGAAQAVEPAQRARDVHHGAGPFDALEERHHFRLRHRDHHTHGARLAAGKRAEVARWWPWRGRARCTRSIARDSAGFVARPTARQMAEVMICGPQVTPQPRADGVESARGSRKLPWGSRKTPGVPVSGARVAARSYSRMTVRNHRERKPSGSATSARTPPRPRADGVARECVPDAIKCLENLDRGCTERKRSHRAGSSSSRLSNPKVDSSANAGNCEAHRRARPCPGPERMASGTISSTADSIRSMGVEGSEPAMSGSLWATMTRAALTVSRESEPSRLSDFCTRVCGGCAQRDGS